MLASSIPKIFYIGDFLEELTTNNCFFNDEQYLEK